jgi:hypothetical protein
MKAFVEVLSGVVRAGPDAERYGDPFDLAVAFSSVDGKTATIKALVSGGELSQAHARAAIRALHRIGLTATWERFKDDAPRSWITATLSRLRRRGLKPSGISKTS